jgi:hypothetical protein
MNRSLTALSTALIIAMTGATAAHASSHREAPSITKTPKVDGTDFYMFKSYEANRSNYVTLIANYLPLQDAYGGPNYFALDPDALYEIHIDNNGDAMEDITFQFKFNQKLTSIEIPVNGKNVAIPLSNAGAIDKAGTKLQTSESYTVTMVKGDRRTGTRTNLGTFAKPFDNVGSKSIPNYESYANQFISKINIPGCGEGKVFVGQRKEGFAVNLGDIFDLINTNPLGDPDRGLNTIGDKNVTSIAMEVPQSCLVKGNDPVVGGWTTASVRQGRLANPNPQSNISTASKNGGAWTQVSRLGMPLVNEVVIGLKDKDKFNASEPMNDGQFAVYVTNPTLPALIETLFPSAPAPKNFPRGDLVGAFLTGIKGLNQPAGIKASEMLRLNTAIAPTAVGQQSYLGVLGGDFAGFPNGRRPGDDVVDASLRVAMGVLCTVDTIGPIADLNGDLGCQASDAPAGGAPLNDGAMQKASEFKVVFPYLNTPLRGSRN